MPPLLRQNKALKRLGIWNWSLPAWAGKFPDGTNYNACKSAGICKDACYARNGTYTIPAVKARHEANLRWTMDDLDGWKAAMLAELAHPKFRGAWVRLHDSGDFHSEAYLLAWLDIARTTPATGYYCYTKEVALFCPRRTRPTPQLLVGLLLRRHPRRRPRPHQRSGRRRLPRRTVHSGHRMAQPSRIRPPCRPRPRARRHPRQQHQPLQGTPGRTTMERLASRRRRRPSRTPTALRRASQSGGIQS